MSNGNEQVPTNEDIAEPAPQENESLGEHIRTMEGNAFVMVPKATSGQQLDARRTYTDLMGEEYWCIPIGELDPIHYNGQTQHAADEGRMEPQGGSPPV